MQEMHCLLSSSEICKRLKGVFFLVVNSTKQTNAC